MAPRRIALLAALLTLVALPATALAKPRPQVLHDVAPLGGDFRDAVVSSSPRVAHAALSGTWHPYPTKEGYSVQVAISDRYAGQLDASVAQSYVDFLDSLDHGPELAKLRIYIAPPDEVLSECGGQDGTLACYDSGTKIMDVPGEQPNTGASGVTVSYVIAHEYGHHIAASRSNDPFNAFRYGPKYWASYEMVCDRSLKGLLAPGNEAQFYFDNPGEAWAETYAQLKYPGVKWQYSPLLQPDTASFDAARRDVLQPWSRNATRVFKGTFGARGSKVRKFSFNLTLDGRFQARLKGPRKANYNLVVTSNGRNQGRTSNAGSRDSINYEAACRQSATEHVTITVKRVTGTGPFTLNVAYAG